MQARPVPGKLFVLFWRISGTGQHDDKTSVATGVRSTDYEWQELFGGDGNDDHVPPRLPTTS